MNISDCNKACIYYWSGTGNSYRTAEWIGSAAEQKGITVKIIPAGTSSHSDDSLVAYVFPTHGFTAPWHVIKSALKLSMGHSAPAFCAVTKAGIKWGSIIIPGISGTSNFIIALILFLKGYNVRGIFSIDMPSNWFSLHPIQPVKIIGTIINQAEIKTRRYTETILSGRKLWFTINNLSGIIWGLLLSLVSLGYLFIGRFFIAKLFFANNNCNGCGLCAGHCSLNAIKMKGSNNQRPYWKYNCESCMRCSAICPFNAVEAGHSWGAVLYYISAIPFSAYLLSWLSKNIPGAPFYSAEWTWIITDYLLFYPAIFLAYFIFDLLVRIPYVNWFFTHTTLTHLRFWGRYKEPGVKLLKL